MRWTKGELINLDKEVFFSEDLEFSKDSFEFDDRLLDVYDVHVEGEGLYDRETDTFTVDFDMDGVMVCPCAITNEPVEVPFESECHEVFSFVNTEDMDVHVVKNGIVELIPLIFQLIHLEIPLKVVKEGIIDYPGGDGWQVFSEEDYRSKKDDRIDPRLAKLKEFKFDD